MELAIMKLARLRPDVAEEERLAPAGMRDDDVGGKALPTQPERGRRRRGAVVAGALEAAKHRKGAGGAGLGHLVTDDPHAGEGDVFLAGGKGDDLMAVARQARREMQELAGEVLVEEEKPHGEEKNLA